MFHHPRMHQFWQKNWQGNTHQVFPKCNIEPANLNSGPQVVVAGCCHTMASMPIVHDILRKPSQNHIPEDLKNSVHRRTLAGLEHKLWVSLHVFELVFVQRVFGHRPPCPVRSRSCESSVGQSHASTLFVDESEYEAILRTVA